MSDILSDLARVKAIFQQRAVCAALGIMGDESNRKDFEQLASSQSVLYTSPANLTKGKTNESHLQIN